MSLKERDNFLRHAKQIVDHVKFAMLWLIDWNLDLTGLTFEQFLNANQHEIHHLCYNRDKCSKCSRETDLPTVKTLDASQLDILFEKKGKPVGDEAAKSNENNCCRIAKPNITTKDLDFLLAKNIVAKFCTRVFWFSCTEYVKQTLEEFLEENKHTIYHLWKCHSVCCQCKSEFNFPSNKPILEESQWNVLFSCKIQPCLQHTNTAKFDNMICAVRATQVLRIHDLDSAVEDILLTYCCKLRNVVASIDKIIQDTYDIAKDGKISDRLFERYALETETCINAIGIFCGKTKEVKHMLKSQSEILYSDDRCTEYQIVLLDAMRKERNVKCVSYHPAASENASNKIPMLSINPDLDDDKFNKAGVCPDEDCLLCEEKTAEYFCEDCDIQLCYTCSNRMHTKVKSMLDHHIETIKNVSHVKTHCNTHNTLYTQICLTHDAPFCQLCLLQHELCSINSIETVKKGVKQSSKAKEIELKSANLTTNLEMVISKMNNEIDSISDKVEEFSTEFDNSVKKREELFTQIKKDGIKQIEKHGNKMKSAKALLSVCKDRIEITNGNYAALMRSASEYNTVLGLYEIEHDLNRSEHGFEKVFEDINVSNINLKLQFSLENIKREVLNFEHTNIEMPLTISKSQIPVSKSCIDKIHLEKCFSIEISNSALPSEISGCTVMDSGDMWFADRKNKRCVSFNTEGRFLSEKTLSDEPIDITFTEESKVAISLSESNSITIYDTKTDSFIIHIKVGSGSLGGLAFHKDKLFVRVGGFGYYIFDSSGEEIRRIEIRDKYMPYITCSKNRFYYTKWDVAKVFCCNLFGHIMWECQVGEILQPPNGLSADAEGNLFVTGSFSHNVVVISADGKETRELISKNSGLQMPIAIYYDKAKNRLLISCSSGLAILYSVR